MILLTTFDLAFISVIVQLFYINLLFQFLINSSKINQKIGLIKKLGLYLGLKSIKYKKNKYKLDNHIFTYLINYK